MEVLNKNQRETAIWRMLGFGLLVLAANAVILFSSYKAFGIKGSGEENELRRKLQEMEMSCKGREQDYVNKIKELEAKVAALKKENDEIKSGKGTKDEIMKLKDEQIKACQANLNACNARLASSGG